MIVTTTISNIIILIWDYYDAVLAGLLTYTLSFLNRTSQ